MLVDRNVSLACAFSFTVTVDNDRLSAAVLDCAQPETDAASTNAPKGSRHTSLDAVAAGVVGGEVTVMFNAQKLTFVQFWKLYINENHSH